MDLQIITITQSLIKEYQYKMTAKIFSGILDIELIQKIESYQHSVKNSAFIARWMNRLTYPLKQQNFAYWKKLIRDSENMVIQLPEHQLQPFNFAMFVQDFFKAGSGKIYYKQFQTFCKNAIRNNPSLLLNRYYVGNGGSPCYELFSTFLSCNGVNGSKVDSSEQLEDSVFNIFKFIMENQYLKQQNCSHFFYGFYYGNYTSKYAVEILQIFFQYYEAFFIDANLAGSDVQYTFNTKQMLTEFFKDILKKYSSKSVIQYLSSLRYQKVDQQEELNQNIYQRNAQIKRFLNYFQQRHCLILQKYHKYLVEQAFQHINLKLLKQLVKFPGFGTLIFSQEYAYHLVERRKVKQFSLLWSFEQETANISKFRYYDDKNILQIAAQSRGLTHNLIDILWASGLFSTMPKIKNQKSKKIIYARYNLSGQNKMI